MNHTLRQIKAVQVDVLKLSSLRDVLKPRSPRYVLKLRNRTVQLGVLKLRSSN